MSLKKLNTNIKDIKYGNVNILKVMKNGEIIWGKTPPMSATCFNFSLDGMGDNEGMYYPYKIAMVMDNTILNFSNVQVYNKKLSIGLGPNWKKLTLETSKNFKMLLYNFTTRQSITKTIYARQKNDITAIIKRALIESGGDNIVLYSDVDPLWVTATVEFN